MTNALRRALPFLCVLALTACHDTQTSAPSASLTVTMATPRERTVVRDVAASGAVAAWEEVAVGVELSGLRVAYVEVEVGSTVNKGDVLLRVDSRTMDSQLAQAQASLAEARTNLDTAQRKARRMRQLADEKMVSLQDAEEAEASRNNANARVNTALASLDAAQVQRDFTVVRAPVDGVVSARSVQPGQVVSAGTELIRLIRDGRLEWRAELPQADLLRVTPGARVRVQSPTGDVEGTIRRVSPSLTPETRTGTIFADLPEPGPLRAGVFAQGRIALAQSKALLVPDEAVVRRDGRTYVFTVDQDNRCRQRNIEVGGSFGSDVEVLKGLEAGERVVAQGAGFLGDGDLVRVVAQAGQAPAAEAGE